MKNDSPSTILQKIKASKNILINMDTRTDFDALCSSVVLGRYIKSLGIKSTIIHANTINETYTRSVPADGIKTNTDISAINLGSFDLIIFVDSGRLSHTSLAESFILPANLDTVNIDHHATNEIYGKYNYVHHLGSCCSVLYKLFKELGVELPLEDLIILTVGIVTDPGFFKYDSIQAEDFRILAELTDRGVKVWQVISELTSYEYLDQIKYKNLVYNNLIVNFDKKIAYSTLTVDQLKQANIDMNKVFTRHADLIKYIVGIDVAFVIAELDESPKCFEVSFRSKDPSIDVSKLAKQFGGGGHITGAGARLYNINSIEEALSTVSRVILP